MYTNAIKMQLKYIDWTVHLYMFQHPKVNIEDLQSSVNIAYVSIFVNYNNTDSDKL